MLFDVKLFLALTGLFATAWLLSEKRLVRGDEVEKERNGLHEQTQ